MALFFIGSSVLVACTAEDGSGGGVYGNSYVDNSLLADGAASKLNSIKFALSPFRRSGADTSYFTLDSITKVEVYLNGFELRNRIILKTLLTPLGNAPSNQLLELNLSDTLAQSFVGSDLYKVINGNLESGGQILQIGKIYGFAASKAETLYVNRTQSFQVEKSTSSIVLDPVVAEAK